MFSKLHADINYEKFTVFLPELRTFNLKLLRSVNIIIILATEHDFSLVTRYELFSFCYSYGKRIE